MQFWLELFHTDPYWSIIVGTLIGMAETKDADICGGNILKFDLLEYDYCIGILYGHGSKWLTLKIEHKVTSTTTFLLVFEHS